MAYPKPPSRHRQHLEQHQEQPPHHHKVQQQQQRYHHDDDGGGAGSGDPAAAAAFAQQQQAQVVPEAPPSSRLCIKNIPKYVQEQRLKDHFAGRGQVTDVKILKTRDGQPRQMAFVGYRTVEDAAAALRYFNNTFIDTSRISIEFARRYRAAFEPPAAGGAGAAGLDPNGQHPAAAAGGGVADAAAPRPWSKYSAGSSKHQQLLAKQQAAAAAADGDADADKLPAKKKDKKDRDSKKKKKSKGVDPVEGAAAEDPKLAAFLQLMQPRAKAKIWSNDEVLPSGQAAAAGGGGGGLKVAAAAAAAAVADEEEDDELYQDLPAAAAAAASGRGGNGRGGAFGGNRNSGGSDSDPQGGSSDNSDGSESGDDDDDDDSSEQLLAAKDAVVVDEGVSDLDYLRARMRKSAAAAPAAAGDSGDGDDGGGSSGSGSGSEHEEEGEGAHAERRRRQHKASTSSGGSDSSEEGSEEEEEEEEGGSSGSDGEDALHWQQQQQQQRQQKKQRDGPLESGDTDSEGEGEEEEDGDGDTAMQQQHSQDDPMAVDADVAEQQQQQQQQQGLAFGDASEAAAAEAAVRESGRLFVRNLAYTAGQLELSELFGQYGDLEEVHLVLDRDTRRSKGIAYVKFLLPEDAVAAFRALDMTPFQGRLLHVLPAKRKPGEDAQEGGTADKQGPTGFKADREAQRKRDAGNRSAWSTLFMRSDTVAAAVAAHYGVSKAQLLDASAEDLPLRMALGEAQVIAQTKAALADAGINTKALEAAAAASGSAAATKSVARSSTSLLVKNLPYGSDAEELQQMFTGPGRSVVRLVLPPTKTLAVVEFVEPQDARAAFKALAYKKYQQVPLYLEWAPKDIWDTPPPAPAATSLPAAAARGAAGATPAGAAATNGTAGGKAAAAAVVEPAAAAAAGQGGEDDDEQETPIVSIYVKNLNFATTDASLKSHFDRVISAAGGQIHSAKVARRKGPDGKLLSMGYGFVETDSEAVAKTAIKQLQGSMLDKHKLTLQLSKRTTNSNSKKGKDKDGASDSKGSSRGTKLVVRNVAFEATRKDIMGLFGPFGHIKSCRLPKKFDGNHRGFAFLEFTTKQEAANALEGVGGTHLYGRRLVVEYAQADDEGGAGALTVTGEAADLQAARAKTAAKFFGAEGRVGDAGAEDAAAAADAPARKRMRRNL